MLFFCGQLVAVTGGLCVFLGAAATACSALLLNASVVVAAAVWPQSNLHHNCAGEGCPRAILSMWHLLLTVACSSLHLILEKCLFVSVLALHCFVAYR